MSGDTMQKITELTDDQIKQAYQEWLKGDNTYTLEDFIDEYDKCRLFKKSAK